MTGPMIFAPEYYTHLATLEAASWWNAGMRTAARRLLRLAGMPAQGTLLDLGCGSGQTLAWFRGEFPEWRTVGFDLSREGLHVARMAGEAVCEASALALPFPDHTFDAAITFDVLQHLPLDGGDATALREARRVLKPGGVLLVRTNAQSIPHTPPDQGYNFRKYTSRELRAVVELAGFEISRLGRLNALLGLAEIPRELRARRAAGSGYHGHLGHVPTPGWSWYLKRGWLELEGALVSRGGSLPLGRTLLALARAREMPT